MVRKSLCHVPARSRPGQRHLAEHGSAALGVVGADCLGSQRLRRCRTQYGTFESPETIGISSLHGLVTGGSASAWMSFLAAIQSVTLLSSIVILGPPASCRRHPRPTAVVLVSITVGIGCARTSRWAPGAWLVLDGPGRSTRDHSPGCPLGWSSGRGVDAPGSLPRWAVRPPARRSALGGGPDDGAVLARLVQMREQRRTHAAPRCVYHPGRGQLAAAPDIPPGYQEYVLRTSRLSFLRSPG